MQIDEPWMQDAAVVQIMDMLCAEGAQAYFVGGCVRNALLCVPVTDIDISTDLKPDAVETRARQAGIKSIPTGKDHGTITLVVNGTSFEVTSFRKDIATDGRRAVVSFADSLEEDAMRRDFTINALYADRAGTIIDPVEGLKDITTRKIRFIGTPADRIKEDYLRILRFFRFFAQYGDPDEGFDADGLAACAELADGLEALSKERIGWEMRKLLCAQNPLRAIATMAQTGILMRILSGATADGLGPYLDAEFRPDWLGRLFALQAQDPETDLKLSRKEADVLTTLSRVETAAMPVHETAYRHTARIARLSGTLRASLTAATGWTDETERQAELDAAQIFPVKAKDLPELQGKALGDTLRKLEADWIASHFKLDREALLKS